MVRSVTLKFYVDFFDVDASGWINGGVYFQYNNRLFEELLRRNGYTLRGLLEQGLGFPPVHYSIDYRSSCTYGDEIVGTQNVVRVGRSSLETEFSFTRGPDALLCQGRIVRVMTDMRERRAVPIPDDLKERLMKEE